MDWIVQIQFFPIRSESENSHPNRGDDVSDYPTLSYPRTALIHYKHANSAYLGHFLKKMLRYWVCLSIRGMSAGSPPFFNDIKKKT